MAQYSSWVHGVAAQQEADVKQNESVAASSILEFNSTEPTASNPGVLHCSKKFQGQERWRAEILLRDTYPKHRTRCASNRCLERPSGPVQREGPRFVKRRVLHL